MGTYFMSVVCQLKPTVFSTCCVNLSFSFSILFCLSEKRFTDESENPQQRTIQMKPVNTLSTNQVSQHKSTCSLIAPIREVEDEC